MTEKKTCSIQLKHYLQRWQLSSVTDPCLSHSSIHLRVMDSLSVDLLY